MNFPFQIKLTNKEIKEISRAALLEDDAFHDVTTLSLRNRKKRVKSILLAEEAGVLCGMPFAEGVFHASSQAIYFTALAKDGINVKAGDIVARVEGQAEAILRSERVALNFLMILSGIATKVRSFRERLGGAKTIVLDTRKTYPLFRRAQKYAVLMGGGKNHRLSLGQMILVKDNHKMLYGNDIQALLSDLFTAKGTATVEVEVDTVQEAREALAFPVDGLLMDNMKVEEMRKVVQLARDKGVWIEISGKVRQHHLATLQNLNADFISASATVLKSASIDFSLDFVEVS